MENWEIGIAIPFPPRVKVVLAVTTRAPRGLGRVLPQKLGAAPGPEAVGQGSMIRAKSPDEGSSRLWGPQVSSTAVGRDGRYSIKGEWCAGMGAGQSKNRFTRLPEVRGSSN